MTAQAGRERISMLERRITRAVERPIRVARARARLRAVLERSFPEVSVDAWHVERAQATSGSRVVFHVAGTRGSPDDRRFIVKLGTSEADRRGLRIGAGALESLHGDPRLGTWRNHVPAVLAAGDLADATYFVATEMPGVRPVARDENSRRRLAFEAAALIGGLHAATSEPADFDESLAEAWVRAPIRTITAALDAGRGADAAPRQARDALGALDDELSDALARARLAPATTHGDFWPGNLLEDGGRLTAIVDWESMSRHLPALDLVHLLLYLRKDRRRSTGRSIGDLLSMRPWDEQEAAILAKAETPGLRPRPILLLHWLHFVAGNLGRHPHSAGSTTWLRLNVHSVLDVLGDGR